MQERRSRKVRTLHTFLSHSPIHLSTYMRCTVVQTPFLSPTSSPVFLPSCSLPLLTPSRHWSKETRASILADIEEQVEAEEEAMDLDCKPLMDGEIVEAARRARVPDEEEPQTSFLKKKGSRAPVLRGRQRHELVPSEGCENEVDVLMDHLASLQKFLTTGDFATAQVAKRLEQTMLKEMEKRSLLLPADQHAKQRSRLQAGQVPPAFFHPTEPAHMPPPFLYQPQPSQSVLNVPPHFPYPPGDCAMDFDLPPAPPYPQPSLDMPPGWLYPPPPMYLAPSPYIQQPFPYPPQPHQRFITLESGEHRWVNVDQHGGLIDGQGRPIDDRGRPIQRADSGATMHVSAQPSEGGGERGGMDDAGGQGEEGMMEETGEWATDFVRQVREVERDMSAEQAMAEEDSGGQVNVDID